MLYCDRCGSEQKSDKDEYCRICGAELPKRSESDYSELANQTNKENEESHPLESFLQNKYSGEPSVTPELIAPSEPVKEHRTPGNGLTVLICIIIVFAAAVGMVYYFQKEESLTDKDGTRTIMVYMIGSNLETVQYAASKDIIEMMGSNFDEETINLLIYTGGAKKWHLDEISSEENAIYEIENGLLVKKQSFEKKLMTEPESLVEFVDYAYENYQTDLYDLILWDHGGGPIGGYGLDEFNTKKTQMSIQTLSNALQDTKLRKSTKFDFIGFDACLMGNLEIAQKLRRHANYLIASEELEPGEGWNYNFLSDVKVDTSTQELGKVVVDQFFKHYEYNNSKTNLTLSVIDLSEVPNLVDELDELFSKTDEAINIQTFSDYSRKLTRKTVYGNTGRSASTFDLVDIKDLVNSISAEHPKEVDNVVKALNKVVIYSRDNMANTNGLSIYFPTNNKKQVDRTLVYYKNVAVSDDYYKFLSKYSSFITGDKLVTKSSFTDITPTYSREAISVEIPQELVDNFEKADYIIWRKISENNFIPVFKSSNITLEGNKLIAVPNNQQLLINNLAGTDPGLATMYEIKREDDYAYYNVPAILERYDDNLPTDKLQFANVNIIYKIKDGAAKGEIIDIQLMNEEGPANKTSLDLSKWQKIQFFNASYQLFDANYNYLPEWKVNSEIFLSTYDIQAGFNMDFVSLAYDLTNLEIKNLDGTVIKNNKYEFFYMFRVADTQGEIHQLNLVEIK